MPPSTTRTNTAENDGIAVTLTFSADLRPLLHPRLRCCPTLERQAKRHTSIKDLIESLRVPHTEIGHLHVNGRPVNFSYRLCHGDAIEAQSPESGLNPCLPDLLRPLPLDTLRFLVDANVAKLGSLLRMAGLECPPPPPVDDSSVARMAVREGRILLTRDRQLLKRKIIMHGHLVRSQQPVEQFFEVISLYGLRHQLRPFSRCMKCNATLQPVGKQEILARLEPLTKKYYDTFFYCRGCDSIYWPGSHRAGMDSTLEDVLAQIDEMTAALAASLSRIKG